MRSRREKEREGASEGAREAGRKVGRGRGREGGWEGSREGRREGERGKGALAVVSSQRLHAAQGLQLFAFVWAAPSACTLSQPGRAANG